MRLVSRSLLGLGLAGLLFVACGKHDDHSHAPGTPADHHQAGAAAAGHHAEGGHGEHHGDRPHAHQAPHGGQVVDVGGDRHLEAVPHASGLLVYLLDEDLKTLPLDGVSAKGTLVSKAKGEAADLGFHVMGDHLHAMTSLEGGWAAVVNVTVGGEVLTARFEGVGAKAGRSVRMEVTTTPAEVVAGQPAQYVFRFFDAAGGEAVKDFQVVHDKKLHTFVVSRDLSFFDHVHPEPQADGSFVLTQVVPRPGDYRVFGDVTPEGAGNLVVHQDLKVGGGAAEPMAALVADREAAKTEGGVRASLGEVALKAGEEATLRFSLVDAASGQAVTDLQPYLGALGHLMVLHEDVETAVHAHPLGDHGDGGHGGHHGAAPAPAGTVEFQARFPKAGKYKLWAQFSRGGEVLTFPWVVEVR